MPCLKKIHGKELSYNNLLDVDAGNLIVEFKMMAQLLPFFKHNNACGLATRTSIMKPMLQL
jgi:phosphoribosylaminoimidazolecarboxamide formyltransferase/IMP cyclohydrolase